MQRFWQEVDRDRNGISVLRDRFRGIVTSVLKVATSKAVWILRNLLRNWAAAGTVPNSSGISGGSLAVGQLHSRMAAKVVFEIFHSRPAGWAHRGLLCVLPAEAVLPQVWGFFDAAAAVLQYQ